MMVRTHLSSALRMATKYSLSIKFMRCTRVAADFLPASVA